jgi:antirestriction protein
VPSAEEYAVHDYDDLPNFGEYPNLQDIADFAELMDETSFSLNEVLAVFSEVNEKVTEAKTMLEDNYCGTYSRFQDYAEECADKMMKGTEKEVPQFLVNYFDYESFARDLQHDMTTIDTPEGVMVFHA